MPSPISQSSSQPDRHYWLSLLNHLARPILTAIQNHTLHHLLATRPHAPADRAPYAPLEALARLLAGIAPWLELPRDSLPPKESQLHHELSTLAINALTLATDPHSPSYMNFTQGTQPLVESAFLMHALLRAPTALWQNLPLVTQKNLITAVQSTRSIKPHMTNWLLFSAMVEAGLHRVGEPFLPAPVHLALTKHEEWYKGDGAYGDGPHFHWDYYNSFVIQPMLIDILETLAPQNPAWQNMLPLVLQRAQRYAAVLERMISPEGTYPPLGRSLVYRFAAFQLLSQIALRQQLPAPLSPAQVRSALTTVIKRISNSTPITENSPPASPEFQHSEFTIQHFPHPFPTLFDAQGILTLGLTAHQPALAEPYISPGSPYLCSTLLLPLGLPPTDPFWSTPPEDWTAKKIWSGQSTPIDHALHHV